MLGLTGACLAIEPYVSLPERLAFELIYRRLRTGCMGLELFLAPHSQLIPCLPFRSLFLCALKKGLALTMGSRSRRRRRTSSGPVGLHANRRITQLASYLRSARFHRPHISWTDLCLVPLTPAHSTTLRYSHGHSIDSPPASINDAKCGGALHLGEPRSPVRYLLPTRIHGERSAASPRQWMFSATM